MPNGQITATTRKKVEADEYSSNHVGAITPHMACVNGYTEQGPLLTELEIAMARRMRVGRIGRLICRSLDDVLWDALGQHRDLDDLTPEGVDEARRPAIDAMP